MTVRVREGLPPEIEWRRLAEASRNIFVTPEWVQTWWKHFGDRGDPITLEHHDQHGSLVAVLPAYVQRRGGLRVLRLAGHGPADELGPACAPADRAAAAVALGEAIHTGDLCDLFVAEQLPGDTDWAGLAAGAKVGYIASPELPIEHPDWDSYLGSKSANLRGQVRRLERQFAKAGATFELVTAEENLASSLDILFGLHENHFPGSPFATSARDFHRAFAHRAFEQGWLRLWIVRLGDRPIGAWYGFRFADFDAHYQSGRAPTSELARDGLRAVGFALDAWTIRNAIEDRRADYRFLRGGEDYKYRWATKDPGLITMAVTGTRKGAIPTWLMARDAKVRTPILVQRTFGRVARKAFLT
jgi:CelD/BcsL family acetyltransferase involved in cellulose biosynthesis